MMRDILARLNQLEESQTVNGGPQVGDEFGLSFSEDLEISTTIVDMLEDGFVVQLDDEAMLHMQENGISFLEGEVVEEEIDEGKQHGNSKIYNKCWKGYRKVPGKKRGEEGSCKKIESEGDLEEAYVKSSKDAIDTLGALRKIGKKIETGQDTFDGNLAGMYANDVYDVISWVENNLDTNDPKYTQVMEPVIELRKKAKGMERELGSGKDARFGNEIVNTLYPLMQWIEMNAQGVKEADVSIDKMRDADKKWVDVARLMGDGVSKISFKTDDGIELANDVEKLASAITNAAPEETPAIGSKTYNTLKNYVMKSGMKSDPKEVMKFVDDAIKQWESGAEFDRSKVKEPTDADAYQGMESSELDRIKQLSGLEEDDDVAEAEYQGRKVKLGKPTRGDVKKFKVYVKNPKGNVVKVNFGDPNMKIKKSNPARRKSFRARHNCDNPGPRHKARYWSCRKW